MARFFPWRPTRSSSSGLDALLHRPERENVWARFLSSRSKLKFLARCLYHSLFTPRPGPGPGIRVVCISDAHTTQPLSLPDGDVLLHAGDLTLSGTREELETQIEWLDGLPYRWKVVVAGNHEMCLDRRRQREGEGGDGAGQEIQPVDVDWRSIIYLEDSSVTLEIPFRDGTGKTRPRRLKVYGSPRTPKHGDWAFQYPRWHHEHDHQKDTDTDPWKDTIPPDTDILLTHGPPAFHLDSAGAGAAALGCTFLLRELWAKRNRPLLHVCGHIHAGYGVEVLLWDRCQEAYEQVMSAGGGIGSRWVNMVRMVYWGLVRVVSRVVSRTVLVNAAVVGGLRDTERREAIVVVV
ncbi:putative phosphoesterase [Thermoascus aurantiacus ATCC 26904]